MSHDRIRGCRGFTLLETLVYLVFGGLVVGVIHYTVLKHQHDYTEQKAMAGIQGSLRNAMQFLVGELQSVAPAGDLVQMDPHEIGIRATRGAAIVCAHITGQSDPTYRIAFATGTFEAEAQDSVFALVPRGPGVEDDAWRLLKIAGVATGTSGMCDWTRPVRSGTQLAVSGDTAGIRIGSPVKPFRQLSYGLFAEEGKWWLGRRLRGAGWELMAGPLLPPGDSGLVLRYLDGSGAEVASAADVAAVEILMRAARPGLGQRVDSLRTMVALRG